MRQTQKNILLFTTHTNYKDIVYGVYMYIQRHRDQDVENMISFFIKHLKFLNRVNFKI